MYTCREVPVLLSDQIDRLAPSQVREMPSQPRLTNKHPVPIRIDEIRVEPTTFEGVVNGPGQLPLEVKIEVAGHALTDDFVCAYLLNRVVSQQYATGYMPSWTWKLKKPVFLRPGERIRAWMRNNGGAITYLNLRIAFAGRTVSGVLPAQQWLPWVTTFRGKEHTGGSGGIWIQETDHSNFRNPFAVPLLVERFNAVVGANDFDSYTDYTMGNGTPYATLAAATAIRAHTSDGLVLVRDPTPFDALFYGPERTWTVNAALNPNAFYVFTLQTNYAPFDQGAPKIRAIMNMIGYREVK